MVSYWCPKRREEWRFFEISCLIQQFHAFSFLTPNYLLKFFYPISYIFNTSYLTKFFHYFVFIYHQTDELEIEFLLLIFHFLSNIFPISFLCINFGTKFVHIPTPDLKNGPNRDWD